jgi:hypothetical protein
MFYFDFWKGCQNLFIILVVYICALLLACSQKPTEPEKIEPPIVDSGLTASLVDSTDTLFVWGNISIGYTISLNNNIFDSTLIYLDTSFVSKVKRYNGSYTVPISIKTTNYQDGNHKLYIFIYTHSKPDSVNNKSYSFKDSLVVNMVFGNARPASREIQNISNENGQLKITWNKYDHFNFKGYIVKRIDPYGLPDIVIKDPDICSFYDPEYIGGNVSYEISIKAANHTVKGTPKTYNGPTPKLLSVNKTEKEKIEIKWTRCDFDSTFSKYVIRRKYSGVDYDYKDPRINWLEITDINDTTCIDTNLFFGNNINYSINTFSKNEKIDLETQPQTSHFGTKFISFFQFKLNYEKNRLYLFGKDLKILDYPALTIIRQSPEGDYQINQNGSRYFKLADKKKITEVDINTFETIKDYYSDDFMGYKSTYSKCLAVNNCRFIFTSFFHNQPNPYTNSYIGDAIALIDLDSQKLITKTRGAYSNECPSLKKVSPSGEYLLLYDYNTALYKLVDNKYVKIKNVPGKNSFYFYPELDAYLTTNNSTISIYRLADLSVITSFSYNGNVTGVNIDPIHNYLGGINSTTESYEIYNLNNGELVQSLKGTLAGYVLSDKYLFATNGFYLELY